jgi:putative transposase
MPRYRRAKTPGGTFFFTVTTYRRQRFLTDEDVRHALRERIVLARKNYPFNILAWVLLPDHLHCIWELPPEDTNYAVRWAVIKRHVTRCCGERLKRND